MIFNIAHQSGGELSAELIMRMATSDPGTPSSMRRSAASMAQGQACEESWHSYYTHATEIKAIMYLLFGLSRKI